MPREILYRTALDSTGALVDVSALPAGGGAGPYQCVSCGARMVAKRGAIKAHHFAHASDSTCTGEGYLHALAKRCFVEGFQAFQGDRSRFRVPREQVLDCAVSDSAQCDRHPLARYARGRVFTSLAFAFDACSVEAPIQGFRADVLLTDSRSDRALAVEIVVSHECEPAKIAAGFPILEIGIQDEQQAIGLREGDLSRVQCSVHNWPEVPVKTVPEFSCKDCPGVKLFVVYRSGRWWMSEKWRGERLPGEPVYRRIIEDPINTFGFEESVYQARKAGVRVEWSPYSLSLAYRSWLLRWLVTTYRDEERADRFRLLAESEEKLRRSIGIDRDRPRVRGYAAWDRRIASAYDVKP